MEFSVCFQYVLPDFFFIFDWSHLFCMATTFPTDAYALPNELSGQLDDPIFPDYKFFVRKKCKNGSGVLHFP